MCQIFRSCQKKVVDCCRPTLQQRRNDPYLIITKITILAAGLFAILSVVFLGVAFSPTRPLKLYLSLSGASTLLAVIFACIRPNISPLPPLQKKERKKKEPPSLADGNDSPGSRGSKGSRTSKSSQDSKEEKDRENT